MYHEFLFFIGGAAIVSLPWAISYRSEARWLREGWNRSSALHDQAKSALLAEKSENAALAETNAMLRKANNVANARADGWFKSYQVAIAERDEARANAQPRDPKTGRMLPKFKVAA